MCAGGGGGPGAHGGDCERALRGQDPQGGDRTQAGGGHQANTGTAVLPRLKEVTKGGGAVIKLPPGSGSLLFYHKDLQKFFRKKDMGASINVRK
jgi:hypothetical protein